MLNHRRNANNALSAEGVEGDLAWDPLEANATAVRVQYEIMMDEAIHPNSSDTSAERNVHF